MTTEWTPLEAMLGSELCRTFMYMGRSSPFVYLGQEQQLYLYKHIDTRRYLNLATDGRCFRFSPSGYQPISHEEAIDHVFS